MREAILQKIETYIAKQELLVSDKALIVGVSGGADSVALLSILHKLGYRCIAAHCNFHLRDEESDRDAAFVAELTKAMAIPCFFTDFDTTQYAEAKKVSIEMAARELRYEWFETLRQTHQAQAIAVAHHADDAVETMFLNLVRGTGLKGLTGMRPRNGHIVRPLLCCSRQEVENYLSQAEIAFVTDSTNAQNDYKRNKIRNQLLPLLEELNPSVRETLYDTLGRFDATYLLYRRMVEQIKAEAMTIEDNIVIIRISALSGLNQAETSTVLFELLSEYGFHPRQAEQLTEMLEAESGKTIFSDSHRLLKNRDTLIVEPITESQEIHRTIESINDNSLPDWLTIRRFSAETGFVPSKENDKIQLDADKITFPLTIRSWQTGDRFIPFGMKQSKKLSDFFTDLKLSKTEKEKILLLLTDEKIAWVIGFRTDNRFRCDATTKEVIEFSLKK